MENVQIKKIKLKGHESFYLREGWLRKGITAVINQPDIFLDTIKAVDELGIGANMVKSLRYWLQATGLTVEIAEKGSKKIQKPTELAQIIMENDEYFENIGTVSLLHYNLVSNKSLATSWYLFFNKVNALEIDKESMFDRLKQELLNIKPDLVFSEKSLMDDCNCLIKTYFSDELERKDPEDNLVCPFSELGLLKKAYYNGNKEYILKASPSKKNLNKLIVFYVILDNLNGKNSVSIKELIEEDSNIGKVFNMERNDVNEYIDMLQESKLITVTRTAGLNIIYPKIKDKLKVLEMYFKEV